jgi:phage tail-like protein
MPDSVVDYAYQTVGFHFRVIFTGLPGKKTFDVRFQSVTGLDVQFETESIREGGENRFEHEVPTRTKYSDLVLKRGLLSPSTKSGITEWCKKAFDEYKIMPIDLEVHLLNEKHDAIMKWDVIHAWPKNWKLGEFNAERSEVLIETLELNYNYSRFKPV